MTQYLVLIVWMIGWTVYCQPWEILNRKRKVTIPAMIIAVLLYIIVAVGAEILVIMWEQ